MHAGIKQLENVTVHVEPCGVEVRAAEIDENALRAAVYEVAKGVEGTLRVKRIVTYAADGKRYINLDCCFTKHVQITEAHEVASRVEKEIKERFSDAVVTVHIEPECA
jgi:divalent metal cation (Fe/Co/Zn/Cd) transporter